MGLAIFRRKAKEHKQYTKEQLEAEYMLYRYAMYMRPRLCG